MYRLTITSQNFSSSSMVKQDRSDCSQAMSVEPLPPKGSSTRVLLMLLFIIGYAKSGTGFMVG